MLTDMQGLFTLFNADLYVPLTCVENINIRQSDIDLEVEVDKFLGGQARVLLLLGDSGAGKSTFCAHLFEKLRATYANGGDASLPVFIKLGPL